LEVMGNALLLPQAEIAPGSVVVAKMAPLPISKSPRVKAVIETVFAQLVATRTVSASFRLEKVGHRGENDGVRLKGRLPKALPWGTT
jgi:hypothetical protein